MAPERTQRLWRALGFPDAADDDPAFTDADVQALGVLSELIDSGFVDPGTEASIARAMGQALSRLADWQTDMLADALTRPGRTASAARPPRTRPWRSRARCCPRCAQSRATSGAGTSPPTPTGCSPPRPGRPPGARRRLRRPGRLHLAQPRDGRARARRDGRGLREHRRRGHRPAPRPGGQDRGRRRPVHRRAAVDAVEIGLRLPEAWDAEEPPPLRVGAAFGAVLTRLGDVYSPVVNLASRLTSIARPGTMLVDRELAHRLRDLPVYRVRPLRRVSVRGYDHLQPWLVRRRPDGRRPRTRAATTRTRSTRGSTADDS